MTHRRATVPERTVIQMLRLAISAIEADPTVLDDILDQLDDDEKAKARAYFVAHPPTAQLGYARQGSPFPLYAVTLGSDSEDTTYVGHGEVALLDSNDVKVGNRMHVWTKGQFTIFVMAENPDVTAWYYRILRRICYVGEGYLIARGLDNPGIQGMELAPDPRLTPDNVFVRVLNLTVEYDEHWSDTDALYSALNGTPEGFITSGDQIDVRHEVEGGGIRPRFNIETVDS